MHFVHHSGADSSGFFQYLYRLKSSDVLRFFALLLLALLSFQTLGYLALILTGIGEVRMEMAALMQQDVATETILMERAAFDHSRSGKHELHVGDALFDIVETTCLPDGRVSVRAMRDQREQDLLHRLGISLRLGRSTGHRQSAGAFFVKFLSQTFLPPLATDWCLHDNTRSGSTPPSGCQNMYAEFYPLTQGPPPRNA